MHILNELIPKSTYKVLVILAAVKTLLLLAGELNPVSFKFMMYIMFIFLHLVGT